MKIKVVPTIISAALSALLAYGFYSWCVTAGQEPVLAIGGFICLFISLTCMLAVRFEGRTTASAAATGGLFFMLMLASNLIFTFINFSTPLYLIVNGVLLLVMIMIVYAVAQANQR